ncbi:hypothetical protein Syun_002425 [Stephania yunnanensis]|uniref:Probable purine permease n=1 Tax=Stephania yunnanensis TaxID=152371 RepID=A0AAP0LGF5_9MAGN
MGGIGEQLLPPLPSRWPMTYVLAWRRLGVRRDWSGAQERSGQSRLRQPPKEGWLGCHPLSSSSRVVLGLLSGADNLMYALGLSFLPVSTSSLLVSTNLAFTAFFALLIARHRFTPYSINAVLLMTLASVLLGIGQNNDRPVGVTDAQYLLGFLFTLGAAALLGFMYPCTEVAFTKVANNITYSSVLQFQLCSSFAATFFCTAMTREAREFGLGESEYYLVLTSTAVAWQLSCIGFVGLIFCASSVFTGVFAATLVPLTTVAAVVVYHEKFSGEKGVSLALCVWGFASYLYGSYRDSKKQSTEAQIGI